MLKQAVQKMVGKLDYNLFNLHKILIVYLTPIITMQIFDEAEYIQHYIHKYQLFVHGGLVSCENNNYQI